jgi:glutamine synthetase
MLPLMHYLKLMKRRFTSGDSDRTASIRIPTFTQENGFGYLEDRRPASNMDPYVVYEYLLRTVEGVIPKDAEDTTTEVQESEE